MKILSFEYPDTLKICIRTGIEAETARAIKVRDPYGDFWIPKVALVSRVPHPRAAGYDIIEVKFWFIEKNTRGSSVAPELRRISQRLGIKFQDEPVTNLGQAVMLLRTSADSGSLSELQRLALVVARHGYSCFTE